MSKNLKFVLRTDDVIAKTIKGMVVDLPRPKKLSYFWKWGFSLMMFLFVQIIRGLLLALCYIGDVNSAFRCLDLIIRDVDYGWVVRNFHSNGASFYFLSIYMHMARGMYYFSFYYIKLWLTGIVILILSMAVGFFGYVLPWGQMSFWAATVITNLFSIIPYIGVDFVQWLWGGFAVSSPTLTRFYALHFLCPFIVLVVVLLHIVFLHRKGSNNPLGIQRNSDKIVFAPYHMDKDLFSQFCIFFIYLFIVFFFPYKIINTVNFIEANPLVTPEHIEPEWYLLAPYTILRSIPNKVGGVLMLLCFFFVLISLPFFAIFNTRGNQFRVIIQFLFFFWSFNYLFLTWGGAVPPEYPYLELTQVRCFLFFFYFVILGLFSISEKKFN